VIARLGTNHLEKGWINVNLTESLLIILFCLLTEIIPYVASLDSNFIKVFSMEYLRLLELDRLIDIEEYVSLFLIIL
jgi:hypothetical protein